LHRSSINAQRISILLFVIPMILALAVAIYLIVVYELRSHRVSIPESEAYIEIGQWGPWVMAILVFIATVIARLTGLKYDETKSNGFEWIFSRVHNIAPQNLAGTNKSPPVLQEPHFSTFELTDFVQDTS
jgi:hypothetical protein